MTADQLQTINLRISQYVKANTNTRKRLLLYALDRSVLSDSEFQQICSSSLAEAELLQAPWAIALTWGRLFYEKSDGNNYRWIIQDSLGITKPDELLNRIHKTCEWFPVDATLLYKRAYRFQVECWITSEEGETSNLWKGLRRFVRKANQGATDQQICDSNAFDEDDITPPIRWLLNQRDGGFCNSLRWLYNGAIGRVPQGNGAEIVITANTIYPELYKKDDFSASLGLRVTGNHAELVVRIRNIAFGNHDTGHTRELSIKQNAQILFQGAVSRNSPPIDLGDGAFRQKPDFSKPIQIHLGNDSSDIAPIPWDEDDLLLFRQSDEGNVSRLVFKDLEVPHVQGRYFYVLGRPGVITPPVLELGENPLTTIPSGSVNNELIRQLFLLDLGGLHEQVKPLRERGAMKPLAMIGRKPFLSIDPPASKWCLHGGDETPVIVGYQQLSISAENFVSRQIAITVEDSQNNILQYTTHPDHSKKFDLTIGQADWGKKWRVVATVEDGVAEASLEFLFLPAMPSQGVCWEQSGIDPDIRFGHARIHDLEDGVLSYPGGSMPVLRPIEEPTWAWSQPMGIFQDFNGNKQFADHQDISTWRIDYILPPGQNWELKFNNQVVSRESGHISLSDVVAKHIPLGEMGANLGVMDKLQLITTANGAPAVHCLAQIDRNPVHPVVGIVDGAPSIYIPADFQRRGYHLFLLRESDLVTGQIQDMALLNYPAGNIHQIVGLTPFKADEGAWLVLLNTGRLANINIDGLMEFAGILPLVTLSSICEIAPEGYGQTFPMLLKIWSEYSLEEEKLQRVGSWLDLLKYCSQQGNALQGIETIFARAQSDRRLLGYGSRDVLDQFFESELLRAVRNGESSLGKLLHLLLECGFNWLAEPQWIEGLTQRIRRLLPPRGQFTQSMKNALKRTCPLSCSFDQIHKGDRRNISRIDHQFLQHPVNQREIGIAVASPNSEVPAFQKGLAYRGVSGRGIELRPARQVNWPDNYRKAVQIKDTQGQDHSVVLKVTNAGIAADYMAKQIIAKNDLNLDPQHKIRIRKLFHTGLNIASNLIGSPRHPDDHETQLGVLFRACNVRFMQISREESSQGCRATIFQVAVLSRLHAWITDNSLSPDGWPLHDAKSYDQVARVMAIIWSSPDHRKALEKEIAKIEWLITWFKNPDFHPPEQP